MKSLLIASFVLAAAAATHADERPDLRHVYRLDFVVTNREPGKAATSSSYTLSLRENNGGEIKVGSNVPLAGATPGATVRADVGLMLRANFTLIGDDLLVDDDVEISARDEGQTFRKIAAKGTALVHPGKTAMVASLDDPIGHKRCEVTLTATKLR